MSRVTGDRPLISTPMAALVLAGLTFREQVVGGESSLAVYEVHDSLIRRAWYFPAEK